MKTARFLNPIHGSLATLVATVSLALFTILTVVPVFTV